jgi:uncharacterized membrane protein HdeD (DUF308 family)
MSVVATTSVSTPRATASSLRRLYFARFGFAVVWAGLFATTGSSLGTFAAVLLVLYPAFDALAAVVDARSTTHDGTATSGGRAIGVHLNIVISALAALLLGVAASADLASVLRVWGAWAVAAGLMQLVVGVSRRSLGGQWAMMASGGLSVVVGISFILSAANATTMASLAGYAALGGVFFLVSALRLGRAARVGQPA